MGKKISGPAHITDAAAKLCWSAIRAFLTAFSESTLREFAADHSDEKFYCLCVYFGGCYGDFFLYLNTPEKARETAIHLQQNSKVYGIGFVPVVSLATQAGFERRRESGPCRCPNWLIFRSNG